MTQLLPCTAGHHSMDSATSRTPCAHATFWLYASGDGRREAPKRTHKFALVRQMRAAPQQGGVVGEPAPGKRGSELQPLALPHAFPLFLMLSTSRESNGFTRSRLDLSPPRIFLYFFPFFFGVLLVFINRSRRDENFWAS